MLSMDMSKLTTDQRFQPPTHSEPNSGHSSMHRHLTLLRNGSGYRERAGASTKITAKDEHRHSLKRGMEHWCSKPSSQALPGAVQGLAFKLPVLIKLSSG